MNAMPWEDLCRITLNKSIMASSPWLVHRFTHTLTCSSLRMLLECLGRCSESCLWGAKLGVLCHSLFRSVLNFLNSLKLSNESGSKISLLPSTSGVSHYVTPCSSGVIEPLSTLLTTTFQKTRSFASSLKLRIFWSAKTRVLLTVIPPRRHIWRHRLSADRPLF